MATRTYRPEDINLLIGTYRVTGFTEINVRRNQPSFMQETGLRGKTTRVKSRDKSGVATITMQQTSPDNDLFTQIVTQDEIYQTGRFTLTLTDVGGQTSLVLVDGYFRTKPDVSFAADPNSREWEFVYQREVEYSVGGNSNSTLDILSSLIS